MSESIEIVHGQFESPVPDAREYLKLRLVTSNPNIGSQLEFWDDEDEEWVIDGDCGPYVCNWIAALLARAEAAEARNTELLAEVETQRTRADTNLAQMDAAEATLAKIVKELGGEGCEVNDGIIAIDGWVCDYAPTLAALLEAK